MFSRYKTMSDRKKYKKDRIPGYHPIRKLKIILTGLYVAVISDFSVAYKLVLSVPVLGFSFIFRQWVDVTLILLATGMMLVAELFNSAIEILCDFVEEREDNRIGMIKDIAAAAAGISIFVWAVTLILEASHFWQLLKI
ncbi:diacylglycerol kinase [Nostoc sp.]|uniref:diacylglycerol kinase n=1 Tax=Nostoc sp. TaxID=1180 RepID=UPI002FF930D9